MQERITLILLALILATGLSAGNAAPAPGRIESIQTAMRSAPNPTGEASQVLAPLDYAWEKAANITSSRLNDLYLLSAFDGWAVGANGTILHWDGMAWQDFPSPTSKALNAIDMLDQTQGWAVGNGGEAVHWDGIAWQQVPTGINGADLLAIAMLSPTQGWTVDNYGKIYRWDGATWTPVASPTLHRLEAIEMLSQTEGWMGGFDGTLLHWNGSDWQNVDSPTVNEIKGLSALAWDDVWATAGTGFLNWDGSQWSKLPTPFSGLEGISMVSGRDGWAVGESGLLVHWDGDEWLQEASPVTYTLKAVDMLNGGYGWAVGYNGTMLEYNDQSPKLEINYASGATGSFFTIYGVRFPANSTAVVGVNGQALGNVSADSQGELQFLLDTQNAGQGRYIVSASSPGVDPGVASFTLDPAAGLRSQEGSGTIFQVPAGIAFGEVQFLPGVYH